MKNVIHIYGASGSGTSTLGRKISEELGYKFMDTDDYFWLPTNPKYTTKRSKEERLALMKKDISENDNIVPEKTTVKNEENANAGNNKEFNNDRESKSELYLNENGMESIVSNLKNTITDNILTEDGIADKIIKQITDDIRLYAKADTTSLEIQLEPETLGKVGITVTSKAGTITAQLVVQNEVAKEAIESQMATLKESFASQDIKVDAVEVTIASKEFEQNLDKGAGNSSEQNENKRRKHISTEELAEINGTATDKETSIDNVLKEMGTTVNYSV